ncbi:MAG: PQQ-binding-like beta-propeller repeat protein [Mariniblastus sp.]|nr:PQQ-binding-like beta-propeller repeat protein [Mariniblastus sp.]
MLTLFSIRAMMGSALLSCLAWYGQPLPDDWPGFLGSGRDGKSAETGISTDWSNGKLKLLWDVELGEGYGIGSVVGNQFFQLDRVGREGRLRCIDTENGELVWEYRYPVQYRDLYGYDSGPRASPFVDGEQVYVYGVTGQLHCVDTANGKLLWKRDLNADFDVVQNFFGVGSSPLVHGDDVLVMVGGSSPESKDAAPGRLDQVLPNETLVVVLDKHTGEIRRTFGDDLASYSSIQVARIHERDVVVVWGRNQLAGFDLASGEMLFEKPFRARLLESVNAATPVVQGNRIFISECYGPGSLLIELDREFRPRVVWSDGGRRDPSLATHWNTAILDRGLLYASSGRQTAGAQLRCVDWETGEVKWTAGGSGRSSLTYVDGHLVVVDERGELFLVRATEEKFERVTRWSPGEQDSVQSLKYPCWSAPVISQGRLYVRSRDRLVCFQLIP